MNNDTKLQSNKKKPGKKTFYILLIVFLAIIILLGLVFWFFTSCRLGLFKQTNPYSIGPPTAQKKLSITVNDERYVYNKDVINILALGTDPVENIISPVFSGQADTLLLFSINVKTGKIRMLPIPRDTKTDIAHIDIYDEISYIEPNFICLAYAFGDGGIVSGQLVQAATSNLFYRIPIHRFGSINIGAIAPITDFVGGVPIQVDADFQMLTDVEVGETFLLNGEMATDYVRERSILLMDGTNLSRMVRQRKFVLSLADVIKQKAKENIFFLLDFYKEVKPYISTDMSLREMTFLASTVLKTNEIELCVMEGNMVDDVYVIDDNFLRDYVLETCFIPDK